MMSKVAEEVKEEEKKDASPSSSSPQQQQQEQQEPSSKAAADEGTTTTTTTTSESTPPQRSRWKGRLVMGVIGTLGLGLYYQFFYARKLLSFKETSTFVLDCGDVIASTGELETFPWYDPRGFVVAWEWRPRSWWRSILYGPQPFHPIEELASISYSMKGDSGVVHVKALLRKRNSGIAQWRFHILDVKLQSHLLPGEIITKSLINREMVLPGNEW